MQNTPATFQRMIKSGLDSCAVYLDDNVVLSYSWEQHIHQLCSSLSVARGEADCQFNEEQVL